MTEGVEDVKAASSAQQEAILYRIALSVLYHQKRERFFDNLDKIVKAIAVLGGSAILAKVSSISEWLEVSAASLVTLSATLGLVVDLDKWARRHSELARDFKSLEAEIVERGSNYDAESLAKWESKQRLLEASEPPAYGILIVMCQNELAVAFNKRIRPINRFKRMTANWVDWSVASYNDT